MPRPSLPACPDPAGERCDSAREDGVRVDRRHDRRLLRRRQMRREALEIPADMFAGVPDADIGAVKFEHHAVMFGDDLRDSALLPDSRPRPQARRHARAALGYERPIMTASAPERRRISSASAGVATSPLATSGTEITSRTARMASQSALAVIELHARAAVDGDHLSHRPLRLAWRSQAH